MCYVFNFVFLVQLKKPRVTRFVSHMYLLTMHLPTRVLTHIHTHAHTHRHTQHTYTHTHTHTHT